MEYVATAPSTGPDYSQVDSREKAEQLVQNGQLAPLLMLPQMFGGDRRPGNVLFVPPFVAENKRRVDEDIIKPLVQEGKVKRYDVKPIHEGKSFIPNALMIHAYDPLDFNYRIAIWGEAVR